MASELGIRRQRIPGPGNKCALAAALCHSPPRIDVAELSKHMVSAPERGFVGALSSDANPSITPPVRNAAAAHPGSPGRSSAVWVLVVLSSLLIVLGTIAIAAQQVLLNTDRWTEVVRPLATNPAVQSSVAETAASLTLNALDMPGRLSSLPAPVQGLAAPIETTVGTFVGEQALRFVQAPQFPLLWVELNQSVHGGLVQLLRGELPLDGSVTVQNGEVRLNLLVLAPAVLERVGQVAPELLFRQLPAGFIDRSLQPSQLQQLLIGMVGHQVAPDFGYVTVMQASDLVTAQRAVQTLDRITWTLIVAALATIGCTLFLSSDRRLATMRIALGVAVGMLVARLALAAVENMLLLSVAGHPISGAAQAALEAVVGSLGQFMLMVLVASVVVAIGAFVVGRRGTHLPSVA